MIMWYIVGGIAIGLTIGLIVFRQLCFAFIDAFWRKWF